MPDGAEHQPGRRWLPAMAWLPGYRAKWLGPDVLAAVVIWALVIPESMAYAGIAGVPVQFGLYSIPLTAAAYMLFGTSRHLFVGPSSTVAVLAASTVAAVGYDELVGVRRLHGRAVAARRPPVRRWAAAPTGTGTPTSTSIPTARP